MFYKRICLLILSVLIFALTGCQTPALYNQTNANVADVVQKTTEARHISDAYAKPTPPLLINQGVYVDKTPISLEKDPAWLKNRIIIRGDQLPFSYYSRTIVNGSGKNVLTHYQVGLDQSVQVSVNYSGSVKGALDLLAAKSGYVYTVHGNDVYWQAFITRTFDIAFMPGQSDYMMGKASGGSTGSSNAGGSTGGSGSGTATVTAYVDDSSSSQYSNLKGTLSIWNDLESTIKQIISADGKVVVSQSTTSVTVRDRPTNVALVGKYVANLNSNLSKQVLVKVQILEVGLNSDFNYGINWSIVENAFSGSNFVLNANYGTPVSITTLTGAPTPSFGISNPGTGTYFSLIVNALKQQGKVSIVSEPRVVCLNNQVSVIRIIDNTGYLASVQTTAFGGSNASASQTNQNSVTSQITPGNLVTGLTLYILPKLMGDKIYLQVNADLINSLGIKTISSNGTTSPSAGSTQPAIQVPNTEQKQFNQRSVLKSGETLILAGFRKISNQSGAMQLLDSQALGGRAATQSNSETIVLITPIILHGLA